MRTVTAARLAWSICALCVAGTIGGIVLAVLNGHSHLRDAAMAVALLSYPVVGALIAARQPRNLVGWVLCAAGLCFTLRLASDPYARYALLTSPGSLPGGVWVAWAGTLCFAPIFTLVVVALPLTFPNGRLLSPAGGWWPGRAWRSCCWPWSATACSRTRSRYPGSGWSTTPSRSRRRGPRGWTASPTWARSF